MAAILSWVISVGANFAHVSPTFRYSHVSYSETYCALFDLIEEISGPYINQTIQQAYKVIFSMQLLGDPSHLLFQYKSGVKDLFTKTRKCPVIFVLLSCCNVISEKRFFCLYGTIMHRR